MRTKLLLAVATFFTLTAAATATAAPQDADTKHVKVVGAQPKQTMMAPMMFDNVQGRYDLEDGRMLTVTGKLDGAKRTLYADMGDGPTEIVHIGNNRFVAMNKDTRFAFDHVKGRKMPDTVRISDVAGRQIALAQR